MFFVERLREELAAALFLVKPWFLGPRLLDNDVVKGKGDIVRGERDIKKGLAALKVGEVALIHMLSTIN